MVSPWSLRAVSATARAASTTYSTACPLLEPVFNTPSKRGCHPPASTNEHVTTELILGHRGAWGFSHRPELLLVDRGVTGAAAISRPAAPPPRFGGSARTQRADVPAHRHALPDEVVHGRLERGRTLIAAPSVVRSIALSAAKASRLARALGAVSLDQPSGDFNCPMDVGSIAIIVLHYVGRSDDVDVWYETSGCQTLDTGHVSAFEGANPSFHTGFQSTFAEMVGRA